MAEIKLTKNELRQQQKKLEQLQKYLPVLQLKKMMLQEEVNTARAEIAALRDKERLALEEVYLFSKLFTDMEAIDLREAVSIKCVRKRYENIAGVEVPYLDGVDFNPFFYSLLEAPAWVDGAIVKMQKAASLKAALIVAEEKKAALEKELREVSIRVNLFEKILIPTTVGNIKKIKVFLGDQELAAVGRAKVAKAKIEEKKKLMALEKKAKGAALHAY